jgi:putative membrane protein
MTDEVPRIFPSPDARMEHLTRFLFTAPPWYLSILLAALPGLFLDLLAPPVPPVAWAGTLLFTAPAAAAFLLTHPLVRLSGGAMTWNRSAFLALCCTLFQLAAVLPGLVLPFPGLFPFLYAFSLGLVSGIRLLVLVATADYRPLRILVPALLQGVTGLVAGSFIPLAGLIPVALVALLTVGASSLLLIQLIEYPLDRMLHVRTFGFITAFLAHLTDGSPGMDDWFRRMGEEVSVPQASLVLRRDGRPDIILTVPNIHPGPVGDAGGGTLPHVLHASLGGQVLVAHGCATHDFNPVGAVEIGKVVDAVTGSLRDLRFQDGAGKSARMKHGSVSILAQRFGDTLLAVGTRAPERTEDLDPSLALILMAGAGRHFRHLLFIDAHNSMTEVSGGVHYGTPIATEYVEACRDAVEVQAGSELAPFRAGAARIPVPFGRDLGFGGLGVQALVIETAGQRTAYVLLDGNNIAQGARETLRNAVLGRVDDAEIMTTDSHVVNTITGKNPIGLAVPPEQIVPYVLQVVDQALADLAPAKAGAATACIRGIVVFGSHRIAQIAAAVTATITFLGPLGVALFLCAYLLSLVTFMVLA